MPCWIMLYKNIGKSDRTFYAVEHHPTKEIIRPLATGHEAFFVLPIDGRALKAATIELEESIPLARLWDLDVFDAKGNLLSRADFAIPQESA